ncbi:DNA replication/repair protein RecF [Criibacterium bergeronii]|nr:DNA replication/repair protein RecF [Criibacterium bergeronii]
MTNNGGVMIIENLAVKDFRNYEYLDLEFGKNVNIIYGQNGQGKTNIVEAIHFLSFSKSFRTKMDNDVIKFGKDTAYIRGTANENTPKTIDIRLSNGKKKAINVNSVPILKISDLMGVLNTVVFVPEDIKIVADSPTYRRNFMDKEISQLKPVYYNLLLDYTKILKNKNILLKSETADQYLLDIYDEQLSGLMEKIINYREKFIADLSKIAANIHLSVSSNKEHLTLNYKPDLPSKNKSDIIDHLKASRKHDLFSGTSRSGIHKDDIEIKIGDIDLRKYGSQGQKKTAVVAIKLSEINIIENQTNSKPVVILDDIFSELDSLRKNAIINYLQDTQTFITTANTIDDIDGFKDIKYFYVQDAKVKQN